MSNSIDSSNTTVDSDEISNKIKKYFGYYDRDNCNITLSFDATHQTKLNIPFEQQVLEQLLISIICNLLYFSHKSDKPRSIKCSFKSSIFSISTNGFLLTKGIMISASRDIFNYFANPFIINMNQIIALLTQYGIDFDISHDNAFSIIKIDFSGKLGALSKKSGKVVNFTSLQKGLR